MQNAHLPTDKLWRGHLYPAGDRVIPTDLAIALNLGLEPNDEEEAGIPDSEANTLPIPAALSLLNGASTPNELTPIPGIGVGRGRRLLELRPETGFLSLDQSASLLGDKSVDWEAIAVWQGTDEA